MEDKMKALMSILLFVLLINLNALSIYEIQQTDNPGFDGTYPSPYQNQTVTITGVITGVGFNGNGFFMSDPNIREWSGIFVSNTAGGNEVGDLIEVVGKVREFHGLTQLSNITSIKLVRNNYCQPQPLKVTSGDLTVNEAYESVLVRIQNVEPRSGNKLRGNWVDDGSGNCLIRTGFSSFTNTQQLQQSSKIEAITGLVNFCNNTFNLNPRSNSDITYNVVSNQQRSWGKIKAMYR